MNPVIPIVFLSFGVVAAIFPEQIGRGFCKLGKAFWRVITFGFTDMRWFYPEGRASKGFRSIGYAFLLFGVLSGCTVIASFCGPNFFAATREAELYLEEKYGPVSSRHFSQKGGGFLADTATIEYRYGNYSGVLFATWGENEYSFIDKAPLAQQDDEPNP